VEEPQLLLEEQQLPNVDPLQVLPFFAHVPSVETSLVDASQVPNALWHPALQKPSVSPQ
jgi:hypothetical protein